MISGMRWRVVIGDSRQQFRREELDPTFIVALSNSFGEQQCTLNPEGGSKRVVVPFLFTSLHFHCHVFVMLSHMDSLYI